MSALDISPCAVEALALALACGLYPRLDGRRGLAQAFVRQFFVFHAGDFNALRVSIPRGGCALRSRRGPEDAAHLGRCER